MLLSVPFGTFSRLVRDIEILNDDDMWPGVVPPGTPATPGQLEEPGAAWRLAVTPAVAGSYTVTHFTDYSSCDLLIAALPGNREQGTPPVTSGVSNNLCCSDGGAKETDRQGTMVG